MKKIILLLTLSLVVLTGCVDEPESNNLLYNACAENGAIGFYVFDGSTVYSSLIFQDTEHRQGIIDSLANTPAPRAYNWTIGDITLPIFGLTMATVDGWGLSFAWSNGYLISQDGYVYNFDFDFDTFRASQPLELPRTHGTFAWFPNAIHLTQDKTGWNSTLLAPAKPLNPPQGISMAYDYSTSEYVSVILTNSTATEWMYSLHFRVDALLNGNWHTIPATENWAFSDIGIILDAHASQNKVYDLKMFGILPPGTYRIVTHDLYATFTIE